jgi:hypothetical protein
MAVYLALFCSKHFVCVSKSPERSFFGPIKSCTTPHAVCFQVPSGTKQVPYSSFGVPTDSIVELFRLESTEECSSYAYARRCAAPYRETRDQRWITDTCHLCTTNHRPAANIGCQVLKPLQKVEQLSHNRLKSFVWRQAPSAASGAQYSFVMAVSKLSFGVWLQAIETSP